MNTISVILILIIINKGAGKGAVKEKRGDNDNCKGARAPDDEGRDGDCEYHLRHPHNHN